MAIVFSLLFVGLLTLLATTFSIAVPAMREAVFGEDRIIEWATVLAFAAVFVVGLRGLLHGERSDLLLMVITAFAALAVLDELSFGERIFGWEAPRILGVKLDAVHDLIRISQKFIKLKSDHPWFIAMAGVLVLSAIFVVVVILMQRRGMKFTLGQESVLIGAALVCLAVAQGIDVNLGMLHSTVLKPLFIEEVLELGAGILLLSFVLLRKLSGTSD